MCVGFNSVSKDIEGSFLCTLRKENNLPASYMWNAAAECGVDSSAAEPLAGLLSLTVWLCIKPDNE